MSTSSQVPKSEYITSLRQKWHKPQTVAGKIDMFVRTLLFKSDYILGAYIFDWWETGLVYAMFMIIFILACFSVFKLGHNSLVFISGLLQKLAERIGA